TRIARWGYPSMPLENSSRNGYKTPSKAQWLRYSPLQNAHILQCMLRFFIGLCLALELNLRF
ncbi:MAG: hypothetical protein PVI06_20540, partial [Desulfobacterales bacterium]